jgi:hypothetical protein
MKSDVIICSRCNGENPSYSKYCRSCGYELPQVVVEKSVVETPANPKKKVSLGLTIGLVIGGIVAGLFIGIIIGSLSTVFYLKEYPQIQSFSSNKVPIEAISNTNRNLPMMIDSETRLDNVMATDKKTFQYTYTLVNMEKGKVDTTAMKSRMEPYIINSVKTAPTLEQQRNEEMTFVYYYKDKNGNYLFSVAVPPEKYK